MWFDSRTEPVNWRKRAETSTVERRAPGSDATRENRKRQGSPKMCSALSGGDARRGVRVGAASGGAVQESRCLRWDLSGVDPAGTRTPGYTIVVAAGCDYRAVNRGVASLKNTSCSARYDGMEWKLKREKNGERTTKEERKE